MEVTSTSADTNMLDTCYDVTGPLYAVPIPRILVEVKELLTFKILILKVDLRISSYFYDESVKLSVAFPDARLKSDVLRMGQCVVW